jgi:hypothetical protein
VDLSALPGGDLVAQGLADLAAGRESLEALLMRVGAPRLRAAGVAAPADPGHLPEHRLYALLAEQFGDGAHSRYNALIRRLVSFERALECGSR